MSKGQVLGSVRMVTWSVWPRSSVVGSFFLVCSSFNPRVLSSCPGLAGEGQRPWGRSPTSTIVAGRDTGGDAEGGGRRGRRHHLPERRKFPSSTRTTGVPNRTHQGQYRGGGEMCCLRCCMQDEILEEMRKVTDGVANVIIYTNDRGS